MADKSCRTCDHIKITHDPRGFCKRYPQPVVKEYIDEDGCGEHSSIKSSFSTNPKTILDDIPGPKIAPESPASDKKSASTIKKVIT